MLDNDYDYDNDNDNEPPRDFCTAPLESATVQGSRTSWMATSGYCRRTISTPYVRKWRRSGGC